MKKERGIKHILIALPKLENATDLFREYLNSGNKNFWDDFIIQGTFFIHLSQIIQGNLLPKEDLIILEKCLSWHTEIIPLCSYTPESRFSQEEILNILWKIKRNLEEVLKNSLHDLDLDFFQEDFKNEYPESYSLLQNLK